MESNEKRALEALKKSGLDYTLDTEKLFASSVDNMRYSFMPDAVIIAHNQSDIGSTLKIADTFGIPIHIRGRGTGCACGALAVGGGWVLSLEKLDFIEIDAVSRVAHVGAGAITKDIDDAASKYGLFYAPDPSSNKYCSIGGNIACNAGGLRAAKYGTTRENTLALTSYLADGTCLKCGLPLRKFACGMNLRDFFIGSEGTLGVVSEAWVKLIPKPESRASVLAYFSSDSSAFRGIEKFLLSGFEPAVMEFIDSETVSCLRSYDEQFNIVPEGCSAVLSQFDGGKAEVDSDVKRAASLFSNMAECLVAKTSKNGDEEEAIWRVRRLASQSMYMLADSKISQDIVLPIVSLMKFFESFKREGRQKGFHTPVFGHARDGNYHIHVMYDSKTYGAKEKARNFADWAILLAISLGGAVSGEHGIGVLKAKYMKNQHTSAELNTMQKIKSALDPKNILNRGVWDDASFDGREPIANLKMPWDKPNIGIAEHGKNSTKHTK